MAASLTWPRAARSLAISGRPQLVPASDTPDSGPGQALPRYHERGTAGAGPHLRRSAGATPRRPSRPPRPARALAEQDRRKDQP